MSFWEQLNDRVVQPTFGFAADAGYELIGLGARDRAQAEADWQRQMYYDSQAAWDRAQGAMPGAGDITPDYMSTYDWLTGGGAQHIEWVAQAQANVDALREQLYYYIGYAQQGTLNRESMAEYESVRRRLQHAERILRTQKERAAAASREMMGNVMVGDDQVAMAGAGADQWSIDAQRQATEGLYDIYQAGGLDETTRAENEMMRQRYLADERSQREALMQQAYARGVGGSGMEMQGQLANQQQSANAQYLASLQNLASGQQRAQTALRDHGSLGSQARGQSFQEDAMRRAAQDHFTQYNTDYYRHMYDQAAGTQSAQSQAEAGANQQTFENQMGIEAGRTGQYSGFAGTSSQREMFNRGQQQEGLRGLAGFAATFVGG
jgi:hypothetical protein